MYKYPKGEGWEYFQSDKGNGYYGCGYGYGFGKHSDNRKDVDGFLFTDIHDRYHYKWHTRPEVDGKPYPHNMMLKGDSDV